MLRQLFRRARIAAPKRRVPFAPTYRRPVLERLEDRSCPATLTLTITQGAGNLVHLVGDLSDTPVVANQTVQFGGVVSGQTTTDSSGHYAVDLHATSPGTILAGVGNCMANTQATFTDPAPNLLTFSAKEGPCDIWTFSGTVSDRDPSSVTIEFGGVVYSLQNQTTTVNSDGSFYFTIQLSGKDTDNGTASAMAVDVWGQCSDYRYQDVVQSDA